MVYQSSFSLLLFGSALPVPSLVEVEVEAPESTGGHWAAMPGHLGMPREIFHRYCKPCQTKYPLATPLIPSNASLLGNASGEVCVQRKETSLRFGPVIRQGFQLSAVEI